MHAAGQPCSDVGLSKRCHASVSAVSPSHPACRSSRRPDSCAAEAFHGAARPVAERLRRSCIRARPRRPGCAPPRALTVRTKFLRSWLLYPPLQRADRNVSEECAMNALSCIGWAGVAVAVGLLILIHTTLRCLRTCSDMNTYNIDTGVPGCYWSMRYTLLSMGQLPCMARRSLECAAKQLEEVTKMPVGFCNFNSFGQCDTSPVHEPCNLACLLTCAQGTGSHG